MILNTGNRTDIPAFYSLWFLKRIQEGFVLARNPYYPKLVTRYELNPEVVDLIVFGTKNPKPMLDKLDALKDFQTYWHVTITPYGKEIEKNVPNYDEVIDSVIALANQVGKQRISWRYDPIFLSNDYPKEKHYEVFEYMTKRLANSVHQCVISFIDLYEKTKRNFPEAKEVSLKEQYEMAEVLSPIAKENHLLIRPCLETEHLKQFGMDTSGCMSQKVLEEVLQEPLNVPSNTQPSRKGCSCLLGNDIGTYNTCMHFCKYCYANYEEALVKKNYKAHDPNSPLLIGHLEEGDEVRSAKQTSWRNKQLVLPL